MRRKGRRRSREVWSEEEGKKEEEEEGWREEEGEKEEEGAVE